MKITLGNVGGIQAEGFVKVNSQIVNYIIWTKNICQLLYLRIKVCFLFLSFDVLSHIRELSSVAVEWGHALVEVLVGDDVAGDVADETEARFAI